MHSLDSPQQDGMPRPCSTGRVAKPGNLSCAGRQTRSNYRGRSTFGVDQSQRVSSRSNIVLKYDRLIAPVWRVASDANTRMTLPRQVL